MDLKDKLVDVLTAGVEVEYECNECGTDFTASKPECPNCGSRDVRETAAV